MRDAPTRPLLLYALLSVLLAGFIWLAFSLFSTLHAFAPLLHLGRGPLQSLDYIVLAVYLVGVLIALPMLERAMVRKGKALAMLALAARIAGWQLLCVALTAALQWLSPVGTPQWTIGLAFPGLALLYAPKILLRPS